jgi:D-lactate dehydrogenase (cytochrome)
MTREREAISAIHDAVGSKGWIDGGDKRALEPYLEEQRGRYHGSALGVARPATTAQVATVVKACAKAKIAVIPQGGNTGLVGGGVPQGGIVLATDRMNRIRDLDPVNFTITAEAGVILADVQRAAEDSGALFPLSLAAEGSCRIGGNIATNAGGVNVLRYGNARDMVLGLEVVLPDGRIWNGLRGLRKDNSGYDIKQLFIGSEGTLGVITAAVLSLHPRPRFRETALAALNDYAAAGDLLAAARNGLGNELTALEVMGRMAVQLVFDHVPGLIDPFAETYPVYVLIEVAGNSLDLRQRLESALGGAMESGVVRNAVIAENISQAKELRQIRESIPAAQKRIGGSIKHDVSLPVSRIAEFVGRAGALAENEIPGVRVCAFGHLGDGNIHFNLSQPEGADTKAFLDRWEAMNRLIHDLVAEMDGSFAAEHGIGMMKRNDLKRYRSAVEIELMARIKKTIDPDGIMNPGKVLPD